MKKLALGAVSAALVAGSMAVAAPASAADYLNSGVGIRSAYYISSGTTLGRGYPGQGSTYIHIPTTLYGSTYSYSNSYYGSGSSYIWMKNKNNTTGIQGFSGAYYIH